MDRIQAQNSTNVDSKSILILKYHTQDQKNSRFTNIFKARNQLLGLLQHLSRQPPPPQPQQPQQQPQLEAKTRNDLSEKTILVTERKSVMQELGM